MKIFQTKKKIQGVTVAKAVLKISLSLIQSNPKIMEHYFTFKNFGIFGRNGGGGGVNKIKKFLGIIKKKP